MTAELLPCPFCGGRAHMNALQAEDHTGENGWASYDSRYSVGCDDGCADLPSKDLRVEAIAAWNRRAALSSGSQAAALPEVERERRLALIERSLLECRVYHGILADLNWAIAELRSSGSTTASSSLGEPVSQEAQLAEMEARKDAAYLERNQVVAALAKVVLLNGGKAGIKRTAIEGWSDDWHGCVYIDTPWGQASWHYHDSQAALFAGLPPYCGEWDGHTTEEKYARLASRSAFSGIPRTENEPCACALAGLDATTHDGHLADCPKYAHPPGEEDNSRRPASS